MTTVECRTCGRRLTLSIDNLAELAQEDHDCPEGEADVHEVSDK